MVKSNLDLVDECDRFDSRRLPLLRNLFPNNDIVSRIIKMTPQPT